MGKKGCFLNYNQSDYKYECICKYTSLYFLFISLFLFPGALGRLIESFKDFGLSIGYYFMELFELPHSINPSVISLQRLPYFVLPSYVLTDFATDPLLDFANNSEMFIQDWHKFWDLFTSMGNFKYYLSRIGTGLYSFGKVLILVLPIIVTLIVLVKIKMSEPNNDYNKDSKSLVFAKKIGLSFYQPIKQWTAGLCLFLTKNKEYLILWGVIWLYNFNVFAIVIEFLAFYFYFVVSFDIANVFVQLYKLLIDLSVYFRFAPRIITAILAFILFDVWRKKIGLSRLERMERLNREFLDRRAIVMMLCGTMGKKKTTAITDIALTQADVFREAAQSIIIKIDMQFPDFPWIIFEQALKKQIADHHIYNLNTCAEWIELLSSKFAKEPNKTNLFGYDYNRYGIDYDDKLKIISIWDALSIYSRAYFIYSLPSSLLVSNYAIRSDSQMVERGNFPLWDSNYFESNSRELDDRSTYSHILDFDALRLGKIKKMDNIQSDFFEFGVFVITEIGKERGNRLENVGKKKNDDVANQNNDGFTKGLKMRRHSATIDNYCFSRGIFDEQRPESFGADARDLCDIVHIFGDKGLQLAMPFFTIADILYDWIYSRFLKGYLNYRYLRGDNTLMMFLIKGVVSKIVSYYSRIYNRFGYFRLELGIEAGLQGGQNCKENYFLMCKKIYSKRFSTDCFSDFFREKAKRSSVGITDIPRFQSERASIDELELENSFFVDDLVSTFKIRS